MKIEKINIKDIKPNEKNPRIIKDKAFKSLVNSIKDFPEMLEIRPIVVTDDLEILGGNQRFRACIEAGLKTVPIIKASNLTDEQKKQFIIKDNVSSGSWDWDTIANEWDTDFLENWGMDLPVFAPEIDYSILDDDYGDTTNDEIDAMGKGVKKAIMIEFETEHYDEAFELIKFWRSQKLYIGMFLVEKLKDEKAKL